MEIILAHGLNDAELFLKCAKEINYDDFAALKFIQTSINCDVDVYPIMGDDRMLQLLYGWEVCNLQMVSNGNEMSDAVEYIIKVLAYHTLSMWFSNNWKYSHFTLRRFLIIYLDQARYWFNKINVFDTINWNYLFNLDMHPWSIPYLQKLMMEVKLNRSMCITDPVEYIEPEADDEDVAYLNQEGLLLILFRLIKIVDSGTYAVAMKLSMKTVTAWNRIYKDNESEPAQFPIKEKQCLMFIAHIYLMAVYAIDAHRGKVIDNLLHNIRFYHQNINDLNLNGSEQMEYTPARFLVLTCTRLRLKKNEFFEYFISSTYESCDVSLFGIIYQAYKSYVLGNLLMELNVMNEQDFKANVKNFKNFITQYVSERERSEKYMLIAINKEKAQRRSHNAPDTLKLNFDYKSFICKGNRMSNIGNYENSDDVSEDNDLEEKDEQTEEGEGSIDNGRRIDPIFQNIPNNEEILNYVYTSVLAKSSHKGWHFAKLVLLLKIIGHKWNMIETWRYHPGLTTEFMLNLEVKLSEHYEDLAKIFSFQQFLEQEFWLTAFYLRPTDLYFHEVKRCGMRLNRKRFNADEKIENCQQSVPRPNVADKFGLLSSTIDVHEIVDMTNYDAPNVDYDPLHKLLLNLHLPDTMVKDLLTVAFQPRNQSFSWALNWFELRKRCKDLILDKAKKRRFVELNMAEANDRLKFLKIDYAKYKHRPQLDYGTIEEGYENVANYGDYGGDSADDDDEFDYSPEKDDPKAKRKTMEDSEKSNDSNESYYAGTRRTRARAAAVIATSMFKELDGRRDKTKAEQKESTSVSAITVDEPAQSKDSRPPAVEVPKRELSDILQECSLYNNDTNGFKTFSDVWSLESHQLDAIKHSSDTLLESEGMLHKFKHLRKRKKINLLNEVEVDLPHGKKIWKTVQTPEPTIELTTPTITAIMEEENNSTISPATTTTTNATAPTIDNVAETSFEINPNAVEKDLNDFENRESPTDTESLQTNTATPVLKDHENCTAISTVENIPLSKVIQLSTSSVETHQPESAQAECIADIDSEQPELASEVNFDDEFKSTELTSAETVLISLTIQSLDNIDREENKSDGEHCLNVNEENKDNELPPTPTITELYEEASFLSEPTELQDRCEQFTNETDEIECSKPTAVFLEEEEPTHTVEIADKSDNHICIDSSPIEIVEEVNEEAQRINECLERDAVVRVNPLTAHDLSKLRGVRVRIKRENLEAMLETITKANMERRVFAQVYFSADDSSGSVYSDGTLTLQNLRTTTKRYHSDSSTDIDDYRPPQKTSRSKRGRSRNMVVTPRSASGLKLRITSLQREPSHYSDLECIQLSSSSSASHSPVLEMIECSSPVIEITDTEMAEDPLYEEEVVPYI